MKLACADYTFPLLPHNDALNLIAALGFEGVDIGLFEGRSHIRPSTEFDNPQAKAAVFRNKLEDRGLKAADLFLQVDLDFVPYAINRPEADRRAKARDAFLSTLEYVVELGCTHVTALPGVEIEGETPDQSLARAQEELAWRVRESRKAGVVFGIEAHVGSIVATPDKAEALIKSVPGLTLTLDYTHFTRSGTPESQIEPLIKFSSHFQVRGAREGRLQCNFSQNTIDYSRALKALKAVDYQGWTTVEYVRTEWERCDESDNLSETIIFRDFLRKTAKDLRL